jgi:hypothetical protein
MILVFRSLEDEKYALNAIVPTLGFFLSTASLPRIKTWWQRSKDSSGYAPGTNSRQ